jgi:hypothetical protein
MTARWKETWNETVERMSYSLRRTRFLLCSLPASQKACARF